MPSPAQAPPASTSVSRALVVSLHDVSPSTWTECREILDKLALRGVACCSLLVIPDHHRRGSWRENREFVAWLHECARLGHEVIIHGYYHQRARQLGESAWDKLTTRLYTADEGEFYDLDRAAATALVSRAREEFLEQGLTPVGFIAPAWLLSNAAETALRDLAIEYTTRLTSVSDLKTGRVHRSQSLVWSVRSGWRRRTSLLWNALLFRRLLTAPLLRVSIHPVDLRHAKIWQQIEDLLSRALADREALTYHAWLLRQRAVASSSP